MSAEAGPAANATLLRNVIDSLADGVLITDPEGRVVFASAGVEAVTGWKADELVGRIGYEVLSPPERRGTMRRRIADRLRGATEEYENELVRRDGSRGWIHVRAVPLRDARGRIVGTVGVMTCIQLRKDLELENDRLRGELRGDEGVHGIVGRSPALLHVLEQVRVVAPTDANVLVLGESGTGKELVARAVHEASGRGNRPLVRVNCAGIPKDLFESEFFGHSRGAFTGAVRDRAGRFELADGGTLFLDEVGEIPLDLQGKLLRVLQEGTFERVGEDRTRRVDVRLVAATNRDLHADALSGRFRLDLYYRLGVFPITLPPLRERKEDIPVLARHFLRISARRLGIPVPSPSDSDLRQLEAYPWPGNVRELQNVVERAAILSRNGRLQLGNLLVPAPARRPAVPAQQASPGPDAPLPSWHDAKKGRRELLEAALARSGGRIYGPEGAAALLGMKGTTLSSLVQRWRLRRPRAGQS